LCKRQFSSVLNEGTEDGMFLPMMQKPTFYMICEVSQIKSAVFKFLFLPPTISQDIVSVTSPYFKL